MSMGVAGKLLWAVWTHVTGNVLTQAAGFYSLMLPSLQAPPGSLY